MRLGKRSLGAVSCKLTANPVFPEGCIEVSHMECAKKYRRQGIASMFLNILAKEADKANNVLVLFPAEDWMMKWYSRFGFKTIQESPVIMARKPLTAVMRQDKHDDRNN